MSERKRTFQYAIFMAQFPWMMTTVVFFSTWMNDGVHSSLTRGLFLAFLCYLVWVGVSLLFWPIHLKSVRRLEEQKREHDEQLSAKRAEQYRKAMGISDELPEGKRLDWE